MRKSIEDHNPEKLEKKLNALKSQEDDLREQINSIPAEEMQARLDKYNQAVEELNMATTRSNIAERNFSDICLIKVQTKKFKAGEKKALEERADNAASLSFEAKNEMERCQRVADEARAGVELLIKIEDVSKNIKEVESMLDYARTSTDQEKLDKMQEEKASLEQKKSRIFEKYKKKRKIKTRVFTIVGVIILLRLIPLIILGI